MFKVISKLTRQWYIVYAIRDEGNETEFLIYTGNGWAWFLADDFYPAI